MADERKGVVAAGFALLWRRQSVLWWVFFVNLIFGALGTAPALMSLSRSLGHTLAGQRMANTFDLGMLAELLRLPGADPMRHSFSSYLFAFLFFLFMLFVFGGVIETYRQDRRLSAAEFFAACGNYFWRLVRLALLSIVPFVVVMMIYQGLSKAADHIGDRAIADQVGIFLDWAAFLVFLLLALWVRLWFDVAQVRAVVREERGMWRNTWRSWKLSWRSLRHLYRVYICISLVAWVATGIGLLIWAYLPGSATFLMFLVFEIIVFAQVLTRLWQLSSMTTWYLRNPEPMPVVEVIAVAPATEQIISPDPLPPGDPGPELPPADA